MPDRSTIGITRPSTEGLPFDLPGTYTRVIRWAYRTLIRRHLHHIRRHEQQLTRLYDRLVEAEQRVPW